MDDSFGLKFDILLTAQHVVSAHSNPVFVIHLDIRSIGAKVEVDCNMPNPFFLF